MPLILTSIGCSGQRGRRFADSLSLLEETISVATSPPPSWVRPINHNPLLFLPGYWAVFCCRVFFSPPLQSCHFGKALWSYLTLAMNGLVNSLRYVEGSSYFLFCFSQTLKWWKAGLHHVEATNQRKSSTHAILRHSLRAVVWICLCLIGYDFESLPQIQLFWFKEENKSHWRV